MRDARDNLTPLHSLGIVLYLRDVQVIIASVRRFAMNADRTHLCAKNETLDWRLIRQSRETGAIQVAEEDRDAPARLQLPAWDCVFAVR